MAQGQRYWQKIQMGRETVAGTAVAATTVWRGVGQVEDTLETVFPDENVGLAMRSERSYIPKLGADIKFDDTPLTFEQVLHLFEASLDVVTPSADGVGSGKIYVYNLPGTSPLTVSDIKTYTLEGGDNTQCEEAEYAVVKEWELKGKGDEAWMMTSTWFARQLTPTTATPGLALLTVEEAFFNKTKLYLDATGGSFGGTQVSNQLIECSIKGKTGFRPRATATGAKSFSHAEWVAGETEVTAELTFLHDSGAVAEKANWRAGTGRLLSLLCEGSALTTPGTSYTYKTLEINLGGKWEKFAALEEDGGASIVKGTFVTRYIEDVNTAGSITVVNEVASVP